MESTPPLPPGPGQRSLAAIVFTDVVSFSARMQADEVTTLRLLKRDFEEMGEICRQHHGSVLKSIGDGLLLYFSSAVQAVACALAMQRAFAEQARNRPAAETLTHRVGIHLGDVFVNNQDVMGDGVNIAARLQAEAEPGGICISQTVYDVVRNKLALQVTRLGPRELKNISQAIPIYKLLLEAQTIEEATENPPEPDDEDTTPPVRLALMSRRAWLLVLAGGLVVLAAGLGLRSFVKHKQAAVRAAAEQRAMIELMSDQATGEAALPRNRVNRTLADWRTELREKRSTALEDYDFAALAKDLASARTGPAEVRIRGQVLQRTQFLFGWLETHLQRYNQQQPLVVRELTGTAPKEIRVFVRSDRKLYYAEGGATRQRDWRDLKPAVLAAIVAGAMSQAEPLPSREAVQGALAFASLYNLPELPAALEKGRLQRIKR